MGKNLVIVESPGKIKKLQEVLFLLTPGCVGFLLCVMLRTILLTMENGVPQDLYGKYPILMLIIPAILILSLLSIVYSVKLFQDMMTLNKLGYQLYSHMDNKLSVSLVDDTYYKYYQYIWNDGGRMWWKII